MFEDSEGNDLLWFPHVSGFPLEMMHMIDGGVIKQFLTDFVACAGKASDAPDPDAPPNEQATTKRTYSIIETELEDVIKVFRPFSNSDQARKLR